MEVMKINSFHIFCTLVPNHTTWRRVNQNGGARKTEKEFCKESGLRIKKCPLNLFMYDKNFEKEIKYQALFASIIT